MCKISERSVKGFLFDGCLKVACSHMKAKSSLTLLSANALARDCIRLITIPTMHCEIEAQDLVTSYGKCKQMYELSKIDL
jgi:hypothetical protein